MHDVDAFLGNQPPHQARVLPEGQRVLRVRVHVDNLPAGALDAEFELSACRRNQCTPTCCADSLGNLQSRALGTSDIQSWNDLKDRQGLRAL